MLRSPDDLLPASAPKDLHRFCAYWIGRAGARRMPAFEDIDPVDIPWALSRLYLVRAVDGGRDFVYRLAGEAINLRYAGSLTGRRIGDLFQPGSAETILERWRRVIDEPAAYYVDSEHPTSTGTRVRGRRVVLPLGPAEGPADHIFGMTLFEALSYPAGPPLTAAETLEVRWVGLGGADRGPTSGNV